MVMRNPLRKRILRELKQDCTKYIAIFIMMVLLISMCSGMRVSNESLKKAYYESFDKYSLEDGHITFDKPLPQALRNDIESKGGIKLYDNIYIDDDVSGTDKTVRFYRMSDEINNSCLLSGEYPEKADEIAIDRLYAKNNELNIGDSMMIGNADFRISGLIALVHYSTLYENNTDAMFDTINFCVAEVTDEGFERLDSKKTSYNYAWKYNTAYSDDIEQAELSDKLTDVLEDVITEYDEAIVQVQIDELTDRLDRAGEEYADIFEKSATAKLNEITDNMEKASEEYGSLYEASIREKTDIFTADIEAGAAEYAAVYTMTGAAPSKSDLTVTVDDFQFGIIEKTVMAMMTGSEPEMPSEEEFISRYIDDIRKPERSELSVNVDDFVWDIITSQADAAVRGEDAELPTEDDFKDRYLPDIPRPSKDMLSTQLDDFLFGIISDAAEAEINGEEYTMPGDEEFEDEIDKSDIVVIDNYVPRYLNNAVVFAIEDIGKDEAGTMVMCYMMIALIAFIFAVTISNTITSEAGVIGTLRASGYTRSEIIAHYMILPMIVTLVSAVIGNMIGYTVMKDFCAGLYLGSYSLTAYTTVWDASAFMLSTVVPVVMMLIINFVTLYSKLKLSPLKFLKRDLKKNSSRKAVRLNTKIPYKTRFSIRILLTNLPGYIVMIVGIMFGAVLIAFGDMLPRMIEDMKETVVRDMICDYQYVLYDWEDAEEISDENAEKFAMRSFEFTKEGFITDEITVYGVEKNSRFIPVSIPEGKVLVSTGINDKYGIGTGDILTLDEKYKKDTSYAVTSGGVYDYNASLAVFMELEDFNRVFGEDKDHFTGYFSDKELDIDPDDVAVTMTVSDFTKLSDQLDVSMGEMMQLFKYFGALFFIIVVYILCKQIIERNFQSIALTKILGFRNGEIGGLYIASTTIAVFVGLALSVPVIDAAIHAIFKGYLYTIMAGYLPCYVSPMTYIIMISTGVVCYVAVAVLQMLRVAKVSKAEALKNAE